MDRNRQEVFIVAYWKQILFVGVMIWWAATTTMSIEGVQESVKEVQLGQAEIVSALSEFRGAESARAAISEDKAHVYESAIEARLIVAEQALSRLARIENKLDELSKQKTRRTRE
jgi:hypothetical protein